MVLSQSHPRTPCASPACTISSPASCQLFLDSSECLRYAEDGFSLRIIQAIVLYCHHCVQEREQATLGSAPTDTSRTDLIAITEVENRPIRLQTSQCLR